VAHATLAGSQRGPCSHSANHTSLNASRTAQPLLSLAKTLKAAPQLQLPTARGSDRTGCLGTDRSFSQDEAMAAALREMLDTLEAGQKADDGADHSGIVQRDESRAAHGSTVPSDKDCPCAALSVGAVEDAPEAEGAVSTLTLELNALDLVQLHLTVRILVTDPSAVSADPPAASSAPPRGVPSLPSSLPSSLASSSSQRASPPASKSRALEAALALARRVAQPPPSHVPERQEVTRRAVLHMQRIDASTSQARGATRMLASLWADGGFRSARAQLERASVATWHAEREAFTRAKGLRKELVRAFTEQQQRQERRAERNEAEKDHRIRLWRLEDNAALAVQSVWRARCARRAEAEHERMLAATSIMKNRASMASTWSSADSDRHRIAKQARLRRMRERSPARGVNNREAEVALERAAATAEAAEARKQDAQFAWTQGKGLQEVTHSLEEGLGALISSLKGQLSSAARVDDEHLDDSQPCVPSAPPLA